MPGDDDRQAVILEHFRQITEGMGASFEDLSAVFEGVSEQIAQLSESMEAVAERMNLTTADLNLQSEYRDVTEQDARRAEARMQHMVAEMRRRQHLVDEGMLDELRVSNTARYRDNFSTPHVMSPHANPCSETPSGMPAVECTLGTEPKPQKKITRFELLLEADSEDG